MTSEDTEKSAAAVDDESTHERQCSRCKNFWPADDEFFGMVRNGIRRYCSLCTACVVEMRAGNVGYIERRAPSELTKQFVRMSIRPPWPRKKKSAM